MTSLPNLHPLLVHFPIALLVTALIFDVACLTFRRAAWLDRCAVSLYFLGVLGAGCAALSGKLAQDGVGALPAAGKRLLGEHSDWALFTLVIFLGVSLLRFEVAWRDRQRAVLRLSRIRLVALWATLVGEWALFQTADRGAALVYRYGVAVAEEGRRVPDSGGLSLHMTSNGGAVR